MTSKKKRVKFLDPADVEEAVAEVAASAARSMADVVLVGGVAMAVYGSDRLTKDVDVASRGEHLLGLKRLRQLSFGGYAARTPSGHLVDVVVRDDEYRPLYLAAIGDARDEGLPLRVVSPEYLTALKMAAARDKDFLDVEALLGLGVLDLTETRFIIRRYLGEYAAREWDSLVAEFEWKSSREEGSRRG